MSKNRYLLDTHCLIWFQGDDPQIHETVMSIIQNPVNTILFSQISLFEISIKLKIGKLPGFNASVEQVYQQAIKDSFTYVNIKDQHIYTYGQIPLIADHRDPFDRLLIATAKNEEAAILSADEKFKQYSNLLEVIWN